MALHLYKFESHLLVDHGRCLNCAKIAKNWPSDVQIMYFHNVTTGIMKGHGSLNNLTWLEYC